MAAFSHLIYDYVYLPKGYMYTPQTPALKVKYVINAFRFAYRIALLVGLIKYEEVLIAYSDHPVRQARYRLKSNISDPLVDECKSYSSRLCQLQPYDLALGKYFFSCPLNTTAFQRS